MMAATGLIAAPRDPFDGLHGLFNDSLPDGWGRLLLDRRLQRAGIDYTRLTPVDRLSAVGRTGMGGTLIHSGIARRSVETTGRH
ncbi:HipA N-terminal domain-containing protein [Rhizobium sp. AN64]|uniref:HipA N-terminal domain-containing protein n=1 Tax=Rhizobium sp. AN64 TaxID=3035211 RepID=UPI002B260187|nr:HipA N-terminal domain-containing protein [Rhizobium sp. AN64]